MVTGIGYNPYTTALQAKANAALSGAGGTPFNTTAYPTSSYGALIGAPVDTRGFVGGSPTTSNLQTIANSGYKTPYTIDPRLVSGNPSYNIPLQGGSTGYKTPYDAESMMKAAAGMETASNIASGRIITPTPDVVMVDDGAGGKITYDQSQQMGPQESSGGGGGDVGGGGGSVAAAVEPYVDPWTPIAIPDMNVQLTQDQINALLGEAKQFGDLKYDPLMTDYANQDIANTKWGTNTIANEKPEWWSSMRNIANQVANALGDFATRTNELGRFNSGQLGSNSAAISAGGINQIGTLESGLTKRIGDVNTMVKDKSDAIANLRSGVEREKGLTVALQNATLQRESIANEKDTRSRMFDMALASATDTRDQQRLIIAKNQFVADLDQQIWQRGITEKSLELQVQSAALENALTQKQIDNFESTISGYGSGSGYSSGPKAAGAGSEGGYYWTDPSTGGKIWIDTILDAGRANELNNPTSSAPLTNAEKLKEAAAAQALLDLKNQTQYGGKTTSKLNQDNPWLFPKY